MKKLYRSEKDSKIAGICGGIGEEFGVDGNIVRLATVFACIVSGMIPLVVTCLFGWIILPTGEPQEQ